MSSQLLRSVSGGRPVRSSGGQALGDVDGRSNTDPGGLIRQQPDRAVTVFRDCCPVLHPVAVVRVQNVADIADAGPVYVAADDRVEAARSSIRGGGVFESANVFDGTGEAGLDACRQGSEVCPETAAQSLQPDVGFEQHRVCSGGKSLQVGALANRGVEDIAVEYQHTHARRSNVLRFQADLHATDFGAGNLPELMIVIAWNEDDPAPAIGDLDQAAEHGAVLVRETGTRAHSLQIDDVPDQENGIGCDLLEKVAEIRGAAGGGPQVDVGYPEGPEMSLQTTGHVVGQVCSQRSHYGGFLTVSLRSRDGYVALD